MSGILINPYAFGATPPIALINNVAVAGSATDATTAGIDTSGSSLLVLAVGWYALGTLGTISDSKGNTWTLISTTSVGDRALNLYYATNPSVGATHTFSQSGGTNSYASITVSAYSNVETVLPKDQSLAASNASATTLQPGSITPTTDNQLIVSAFTYVDATTAAVISIDSGFTITNTVNNGSAAPCSMAYKIQTTATAVNPTWTKTLGATNVVAAQSSFKKV